MGRHLSILLFIIYIYMNITGSLDFFAIVLYFALCMFYYFLNDILLTVYLMKYSIGLHILL